MGKKIDSFILSVIAASVFYFYFQSAYDNRLLSLVLALMSFIVFRKSLALFSKAVARMGWIERRRLRKSAGGLILSLAAMPAGEAGKRITALVQACYKCSSPVVLIQTHPALTLPPQQLFEIWRQHCGKERLVICATCKADAGCRSLAASLKGPKIALLDASDLSGMIAEHPDCFNFSANVTRVRFRVSRLRDRFLQRKNAPRCFLISISMLSVYLFSAKPAYLICALLPAVSAFASIRRKPRPAKLF